MSDETRRLALERSLRGRDRSGRTQGRHADVARRRIDQGALRADDARGARTDGGIDRHRPPAVTRLRLTATRKEPGLADFADIITTVLDRGASDLHISVGSPPIIRVQRIAGAAGHTRPAPTTPANSSTASSPGPAAAPRERVGDRLLVLGARPGTFPCQRLLPAQRPRRGVPPHPDNIKTLEELGLPKALHDLTSQAPRAGPRHRPDRVRQVHDARGDDRRDQRDARRATS